jgi:GNAT superfamily N-acetyltransferase
VTIRIERLRAEDVALLARIDRSEHVDIQYAMRDGKLVEVPVVMADIPPWDADRVAAQLAFATPIVEAGGVLFGAFDGDDLAGIAIVDPDFEPPMAWFASLHVSRSFRRRGAATALWRACADIARDAGATTMYVSATETGSAVGFYFSQGCRLADPVHPGLFEHEPDDIHLVCEL